MENQVPGASFSTIIPDIIFYTAAFLFSFGLPLDLRDLSSATRTRDRTRAPCRGSAGVLTTGRPRNSLHSCFECPNISKNLTPASPPEFGQSMVCLNSIISCPRYLWVSTLLCSFMSSACCFSYLRAELGSRETSALHLSSKHLPNRLEQTYTTISG